MQLLAACVDQPVGLRNRAMVFTLLDTGLRCSEVVQLEIGDLDTHERRLLVLSGKGNKQRVVPFADRCRDAIEAYLALRGSGVGPLFLASSPQGQLKGGRRAATERPEADAAPARPQDRHREGAGTPLPSHLRDLGDRTRCSRTRRPIPARTLVSRHGAEVLIELPVRAGGAAALPLLARRPDALWEGRFNRRFTVGSPQNLNLTPDQLMNG